MNKDIFHNQLALTLGYERILNDKQINIRIDDSVNSDNPKVMIDAFDGQLKIEYDASQTSDIIWEKIILAEQMEYIKAFAIEKEIDKIFDATHQAYTKATINRF